MKYKFKSEAFHNMITAKSEPSINLEEIAFQHADEFVNKAEMLLADIRGYIRDNRIKDSDDIPVFVLKPLAKCFEERFGPRFVIDANNIDNAFTITDHPDLRELHNLMKKGDAEALVRAATSKDLEEAAKTEKQMEAAQTGTTEDLMTFRETTKIKGIMLSLLQKSKVTVEDGIRLDVKNGKILGRFAKECFIYVSVDFVSFFNKRAVTDKEVLAIMLHEVGHNFFRLETASKIYADVFLLNNVIIENYEKSPTEILNIFYKEAKMEKDKDAKPKNVASVVISAAADILTGQKRGKNDTRLATTNEQYADEFAGRFGLSSELISGLNKVTDNGKLAMLNIEPLSEILDVLNWTIIAFCFTKSLSRAFAASIIIYGTFWCISLFIMSFFRYGNSAIFNTYDDYLKRLQRARNTAIRCLAAVKNEDARIVYVNKVSEIDEAIGLASKNKGVLEKTVDVLGKYIRPGQYKSFRTTELLEAMMANDLILIKDKIKIIGR